MGLGRRTFMAGSIGFAAGAMSMSLLGPGHKDGRRGAAATGDMSPSDGGDSHPTGLDLGRMQWTSIQYYLHETNPDNRLVRDRTDPTAPCSIAAMGMALATLPVSVERGVLFRPFAAKMARRKLKFLLDLPQGPGPDCSGYKGFFYHFLDIETGRRAGGASCRRSTRRSSSPGC